MKILGWDAAFVMAFVFVVLMLALDICNGAAAQPCRGNYCEPDSGEFGADGLR
jgi:hypothetical protein